MKINKKVIKERNVKYLLKKLLLRKSDVLKISDFVSLRNLLPGQFLGSTNSRRYY